MKNHLWRPLLVIIIIIGLILTARKMMIPGDFGVWERGYMYGWHRKANEAEWRAVKARYLTIAHCRECHRDKYAELMGSPHRNIGCENCHGAAPGHPRDPAGYTIDRSRALCLRCHAALPYPKTIRGAIRGINPEEHYFPAECVMCHIPHNPKPMLQELEVKP